MLSLETVLTFSVASLILCLAPGPDNIFVLTHSAVHGRKAGLLVTLGLCTGLLGHTTAVTIGVAAILKTSIVAFTALKMAGACYLLYLAWNAFTARSQALVATEGIDMSALYRRGIIMNITNPKVSIFFLAFLPQFVNPEVGNVTLQFLMLGGIFILCTIVVFGNIAILAGYLGQLVFQSAKVQSAINIVAGFVFLLLAVRIAFSSQ